MKTELFKCDLCGIVLRDDYMGFIGEDRDPTRDVGVGLKISGDGGYYISPMSKCRNHICFPCFKAMREMKWPVEEKNGPATEPVSPVHGQ